MADTIEQHVLRQRYGCNVHRDGLFGERMKLSNSLDIPFVAGDF